MSQQQQQQNGHSSSVSLEDAMDRVMGVATGAASTASFLPSPSWQGPKVGYYFGTASQGTGYYYDHHNSSNSDTNDMSNRMSRKKNRGQADAIEGDQQEPPRTAVRFQEDRNQTHRYTGEELLQRAEEQQQQQQQQQQNNLKSPKQHHQQQQQSLLFLDFTPKGLQQATATLSKWHTQNAMQRAEFASDPHMYMDSEVQLQQAIVVWKGLAAQPRWFSTLLRQITDQQLQQNNNNKTRINKSSLSTTPVLSTLQQLLVHENADIAVSVISVFGEWLDPQVIEDVDEDDDKEAPSDGSRSLQDEVASHLFRLAYWLVVGSGSGGVKNDRSPSGWDCIISNLGRLSIEDDDNDDDDEEDDGVNEDFQGVQSILNLTEQLLELDVLRLAAAAAAASPTVEEEDPKHEQKFTPSWVPHMMQTNATSSLLSWLLGSLQDAITAEKIGGDNTNSILGQILEVLSSLAQREEIYATHPDWTQLPSFRSIFEDDEEGQNQDDLQKKKKQKTDPADNDQEQKEVHLNGVEIMLQLIAPFRKRNPTTDAQLDWLENACLTLASELTFSPTKHLSYFLEGQGIELVLRCLKEQVHAGGVGLKLLDFNPTISTAASDAEIKELNSQAQQACEYLVKAGGFKFLFPLLMGRSLPRRAQVGPLQNTTISAASKRQEREWHQTIQDQTIRILYALSRYLTDQSPHDAKARFLSKFVEANFEKCDRLVELALKYDQKTRQAEYRFYRNSDEDVDDNEDKDEHDETAALQAKLLGGGDLFYCLCAVCAYCCVGSKRCHERIVARLDSHESGLSLIQTGLQEFVGVLDDGIQKDQVLFYLRTLF